MDFSNERYVCLYVRDTTTWKRLPWQSRMLLPNVLRKLDRSGLMELEGMTPAACVALHLELPIEFLIEALPPLFRPMDPNDPSTAILTLTPTAIFWPRFAEGQDTNKSDKQRQRESRENRALKAKRAARTATQSELFVPEQSRVVTDLVELGLPPKQSPTVTNRDVFDESSRHVTASDVVFANCHTSAASVTPAEPSLAEHGMAEPSVAAVQTHVVLFRQPLPPEPPNLPASGPPLWRQILKWHADAFAEALAGLSPPRHPKRDEAARRIADFSEKHAPAYRTTPEGLGRQIIAGLFQSHRASEKRFPIGFAANDPAEYLPPPPGSKALPKPPRKAGAVFDPAACSPDDEHQRDFENNPAWLKDAHVEAAQ
jgi:hypothetical protein